MRRQAIVSAFAAVLLCISPAAAQQARSYALATGTTGGTYYPVGVAIEALVKALLGTSQGLQVRAIPTGGSSDNLRLIAEGEVQLAMLQGIHTRAWHGDGPARAAALSDLRSVTMLWPDIIHIALRSALVRTGSVHDLGDIGMAPIAIGRSDSGAMMTTTALLVSLGIEPAYLNVVDVGGYDAMAQAFEAGTIDGGSLLGGLPMAALTRAMTASADSLTLLSFGDADVEAANARFGALWQPYAIPAGTYPGQEEEVLTLAEPNALVVRADVPEEDVYLLTKAIFQNLRFLANMHPAAADLSLEHALSGMALPLHPGAARYFAEAGVEIPEALLPADQIASGQ
jgi:TRAP transporter TAXI family solute receptor